MLILELLKLKWVNIILIGIAVMIVVNIFSKFVDNLFKLVINIKTFILLIWKYIKNIFSYIFKIIFFPYYFIKGVQKYFYIKSLIINNSEFKDKPL